MAEMQTSLAPDNATELREVIGDDATATFESDPKFIDSDWDRYASAGNASAGNVAVQRDTDDTEDSEEEEDELDDDDDGDEFEEEEEEEDDDDDDEDEDEEEDEEVDEDADEVGASALRTAGSTDLRGRVVKGMMYMKSALDEDDDAGDEGEAVDSYIDEDSDATTDSDSAETDRAIDSALRMTALVAVTAEYAASV